MCKLNANFGNYLWWFLSEMEPKDLNVLNNWTKVQCSNDTLRNRDEANCYMKETVNNGSIHLFQVLEIKRKEKKWIWGYYTEWNISDRERQVSYPVTGSVQFTSVAQLRATLYNPMDCSTPGLPVHHQLLELTQTHVHWVGNAIQPSLPLSFPFLPALNLSQHQGLFKWVISLHQAVTILDFQLQHQSFQWTPKTDFL